MRKMNGRIGRESGQTLIAAMIVLGVLMIVGFVFVGVVGRNIFQSGTSRHRSQSYDLAQAGIRYAHAQMLNSVDGADWRPVPTLPFSARDPDLEYLNPDPDANPNNGDQGGPDGKGAYTRVNYGTGRFLVRVRYAPSDAELFSTAQNGPLRKPGKARDYIIVESVGRIGNVNPQDPTTQLGKEKRETAKLIAFVSIGIIEHAMYITNADRTSNAAEVGTAYPLGARFGNIAVEVPWIIGYDMPMFNFGNPPTPTIGRVGLGGGLYANCDVSLSGQTIATMNQELGDAWLSSGTFRGIDNSAQLVINRWTYVTGPGWQNNVSTLTNAGAPSLDSRSGNFSTIFGTIRDAMEGTDQASYWRAVGPKASPSIIRLDPETGLTRYYQATRNSGVLTLAGQDGRFGHGRGVYVNNTQDRQMHADEEGREGAGSAESLVYDWFHPNNGQANTGWVGPYYIPRGAYLLFDPEGFTIVRDPRATGQERTWKRRDGSDTGSPTIRFRIGLVGGRPYIINTYTPGVNIGDPNPNFSLGRPFNGVLYFEGNVRVRGPIPTDVQMTVVSNATIYVEGSITKGVVRNHVSDPSGPPSPPDRLNRPSRSMLMLMAKDYVALNPTMFFGPSVGQSLEEVSESANPVAWNPLRVRVGSTFTFRGEFLWDPASGSGPGLPNTWESFAEGYVNAGNLAQALKSKLVISHATDDGAAPFTFMSMYVNYGLPTPDYFFAQVPPNSAAPYFNPPNAWAAIYGLGSETWQRYPKFETTGFDLLDPATMSVQNNGFLIKANAPASYGDYSINVADFNDFTLRHNQIGVGATNDYILGRAAIFPFDIRIEASMFAEQGSFAVIPGNWFNPNPNDTRSLFEQRIADFQAAPYNLNLPQAVARATAERRENFGSGPEMPFFGEPLDVKISMFGAISQNMPLPMSYQAEWQRKWGWIPKQTGYQWDTGTNQPVLIPTSHNHPLFDVMAGANYVPNLTLTYDPGLATATWNGFGGDYLRRDAYGRPLPPMPALPVSPALSYFGEILK